MTFFIYIYIYYYGTADIYYHPVFQKPYIQILFFLSPCCHSVIRS